MTYSDIEIKAVISWPMDDIVELYKAGGWWKSSYDPAGIPKLIKGSYLFAVVIQKQTGKAIGMGRVISDGVSDAYLQDVVILPAFRRQGLGKKLITFLLDHCYSKGILWIALIAEPDQDRFYRALNFKIMDGYVPMKYHSGE
jgi:ribosomal protein S18 acetylase RimI-like enzyme